MYDKNTVCRYQYLYYKCVTIAQMVIILYFILRSDKEYIIYINQYFLIKAQAHNS